MRYWDSSGLVPLMINEPATSVVSAWLADDAGIVTWWGSVLERASAVARRHREGHLNAETATGVHDRLARMAQDWDEIGPSATVRDGAVRLVRSHALRAGDALQLSAALVACDAQPSTLEFVSFDERLLDAARREGFPVLPTP